MSLAAELYAAHRAALPDPTAVPAWGNAPTEERIAWERAAQVAQPPDQATREELYEFNRRATAEVTALREKVRQRNESISKLNAYVGWNATNACSGEDGCWCDAHQAHLRATCTHIGIRITGGSPRRTVCNDCGVTLSEESPQLSREVAELERVIDLGRAAGSSAEIDARVRELGRDRLVVTIDAHYTNSAVVDQVREGQRRLNELGAIAVGRDVLAAAEAVRDHQCVPRTSNCSAGEHDDCGLRDKESALNAAVDSMRTARDDLGLPPIAANEADLRIAPEHAPAPVADWSGCKATHHQRKRGCSIPDCELYVPRAEDDIA